MIATAADGSSAHPMIGVAFVAVLLLILVGVPFAVRVLEVRKERRDA